MGKGCLGCGCLLLAVMLTGCSWQLQEIRSKTKFGPEIRNRGNRTTEIRWTSIEQGYELKWDNGWTTGLTYRRRDVDNGGGGDDNRFLVEFSFPLWKASKGDPQARRIRILEQRLALLEAQSQAATASMNAKEETEGAPAAGAEGPAMADSRRSFNRD